MLDLVTDALACHRLTRLIVEDSIFDRQRAHVLESLRVAQYDKARELLRCGWCTGIWVGFGVVAARRFMPRAWSPVARGLAFADVAGVVSQFT